MIEIKQREAQLEDSDFDKPNRIIYRCVNCDADICVGKPRKYCDDCVTAPKRREMVEENAKIAAQWKSTQTVSN